VKNSIRLPLRAGSLVLTLAATAFAGDYSTWGKYRTVTINAAGITTTGVARVPVPIRFTSASHGDMFSAALAALPGGSDLRVTKADGTTDVPFEIDHWNVGGPGTIWVLLDTVPAGGSVALRIYWHKSGAASASNGAAVFSPANGFVAAWHFSQPAGAAMLDATGNNNTANPAAGGAAPTEQAGSLIGTGKTFNGTSQFYQVGTDSSAVNLNTNTGPYTITAWANVEDCTTRISVFSKYANSNSVVGGRQYVLQTGPNANSWRMTNSVPSLAASNANNEFATDDSASCVSGSWTYLAATYNTGGAAAIGDSVGARTLQMRVNARPLTYGKVYSQTTGASIGRASNTFIGKLANNERYMRGSLDELTVSNVVRSADWLKLSYETQKAGATTTAISSESVTQILGRLPSGRAVSGFGIRSGGAGVTFDLPANLAGMAGIKLVVLDPSGREVWSRAVPADARQVSWNGPVTPGLYLARAWIGGTLAFETRVVR
jgi:hypothetical protein